MQVNICQQNNEPTPKQLPVPSLPPISLPLLHVIGGVRVLWGNVPTFTTFPAQSRLTALLLNQAWNVDVPPLTCTRTRIERTLDTIETEDPSPLVSSFKGSHLLLLIAGYAA
jgi:hypothetical protein